MISTQPADKQVMTLHVQWTRSCHVFLSVVDADKITLLINTQLHPWSMLNIWSRGVVLTSYIISSQRYVSRVQLLSYKEQDLVEEFQFRGGYWRRRNETVTIRL